MPPVVVKVETQRTWDATENWARVTAQDDNSGVVAIGWERAEKDMGSRHAPDPITWVDSTAEATFIFTENGSYNAYARDLAGNVSEPYPFIIDHIDKHSDVYKRQSCGFKSLHPHQVHVTKKISVDFVA